MSFSGEVFGLGDQGSAVIPSVCGLCRLSKDSHQRSVSEMESLGWMLSVTATVYINLEEII